MKEEVITKNASPSPFGGLLELTDEEILETIREFPYVMSRLKDC